MLHGSKASSVKLVVSEDASYPLITEELLWHIRRWAQFCVEQEGIIQAWIGRVDEKNYVHWLTSSPVGVVPSVFSATTLQGVVRTKEVFLFRDHDELISAGLFPLAHNNCVIGVLGLLSNQTDYFKPGTLTWIKALARMISDNMFERDESDEEKQIEHNITRILQSSLDVREHLPKVLQHIAWTLHADAIAMLGYFSPVNRYELIATHGLAVPVLAKIKLYFEAGLAGINVDRRQPTWVADLQAEGAEPRPICRLDEEGFRSYLCMPLIGHNELTGVLEIVWHEPQHTKTWNDEFLERVAEQIAFAVQRSGILKDIRQHNSDLVNKYNAMIEGLSRALELRDIETEGHTRRVSQLAMNLVEHMGIPSEEWDAIRQGALLHDIGKLGIPDAILLKPGSLTPKERKVMQQHVLYGYNILAPIINARHTLDIALYHHEHWDGNGYPYGLKGEQIPLVARLFTVIDVYDALTSDRPYRPAWSPEQVISYLTEQAGHEFDPQIVKVFLEVVQATD